MCDRKSSPLFTPQEIGRLVDRFTDVLNHTWNIQWIEGDTVIVGDLHGSLKDLTRVCEKYGRPEGFTYLFLGDYVDRGAASVDVFVYLMKLKLRYPETVVLLRGNHEFEEMNRGYGLYDECLRLYGSISGEVVFRVLNRAFRSLQLAAVVNGEFFCVHGGIGPEMSKLSDIEKIDRFDLDNYDESEIVTSLVWNDPNGNTDEFVLSDRGVGYLFGAEALSTWLESNRLVVLIRGHSYTEAGYSVDLEKEGDPLCLTVFTSSGYMGLSNSTAVAIVKSDGELLMDSFSP